MKFLNRISTDTTTCSVREKQMDGLRNTITFNDYIWKKD